MPVIVMGIFFGVFMLEKSEFEKILKRYIEELKKEDEVQKESSEKQDDSEKKKDRTKELEKLLRNMI